MHGLHRTYDMLKNQLDARFAWNLASIRLETVLVLVEDMCMVYA